ncbi:rRNA adenine N(6)-methyltransferase family protein [Candidatus Palauibacter sp.]|uniref:rRNA adenine N(6)-methyltransferase family protein n=1 Tax=Candidatus Palauibacter sp. TaxID=3101350 RepID=UPI003AF29F81
MGHGIKGVYAYSDEVVHRFRAKASTGSGRSRPPVPGEAGAYKNGNHLTPGLAEVSASGCGLHLLSPGEDFTWFHPAEGSLAAGLIAQAPVKRSDLVVEIGPGRGILTRELARRCREVVAVEFDGALSEALRTRFPSDDRVTIVRSDFLRFRLPDVPYKVLGNIPFNRTAAIVRRLVQAGSPPQDAWLVIQREAAERFAGSPCSRETLSSLLLKPWWQIEIVRRFCRTDFDPPPGVDQTACGPIPRRLTPV